MQAHTSRGNVGKTAIGYVRVSTQEQAAEGVSLLGRAPYGYEYVKQVDDKGRRLLGPLASEQEVIGRIGALHAGKLKLAEIARRLNGDRIPARQGGAWCGRVVSVILRREGKYTAKPYTPRVPRIHDKAAAATRAREFRAEGLSLRKIGARLRKEGLVPARGGEWHAASVLDCLRYREPGDTVGAAQRARELRAEGLSLREVGIRLALEGHVPEPGGAWYPKRVSVLLASSQTAGSAAGE